MGVLELLLGFVAKWHFSALSDRSRSQYLGC